MVANIYTFILSIYHSSSNILNWKWKFILFNIYIPYLIHSENSHTIFRLHFFFIIFVQKYLHATSTVTRLETTSPWLETATHWQENSSNTSITWLLFNSNLTSLYRLLVFSSNPSFSSVGFVFSSLQTKYRLVAWAARQLRFPVTSLLV